jgi:Outer membrane lipoprotein-sorting protein
MRLAPVVSAAMLLLATIAHAADAPAVLAIARKRIETADFRASGRLIRVDATGNRISNAITMAGHWFPGVLRVLVQVVPSRNSTNNKDQNARVSILFEMRPSGLSTIRIFRPRESQPVLLPFEKWSENVAGSNFNYEDFLQPEYYWRGQTILKSARFGARDCDVLKSEPSESDRSRYAEVETWLDHTISYPVYVEKKLKYGGDVKEFTYFGLNQSGGVWSARQVEVKIHGRPGTTTLIIEKGSTKANLSIRDFSSEQISRFEDHP